MAKAGRAPTTPDDEGERDVEGVAASLKGLDDDTVLIVTSFLPECRDVLSLSVTRALPETAWRAAHTGEATFGVVDAIFDSDQILRGDGRSGGDWRR